ncbi:MAG: amino acid ABC transporter permease [Rhodospirillales bacterium]|nr:amino acid ABC transporter permease [Rhodospirillales bacterium]
MTLLGVDWSQYYGGIGLGLLRTVEFTAVSYVGAILLGAVVAIGRTQKIAAVRRLAGAYVEVVKNVPLLTWIFVLYFGLPSVGIRLSGFIAGSLALILFYGSYIGEVFRGGLQGVGAGQREAAHSMGLSSWQGYRYVVLPQALRLALAGTGTMLVDLIKATSLLVTIAGRELMTQGQVITSVTFKALQVYLVIGALYFLLCYPTSQSVLWLERHLGRGQPLSLKRRHWLAIARALQSNGTR